LGIHQPDGKLLLVENDCVLITRPAVNNRDRFRPLPAEGSECGWGVLALLARHRSSCVWLCAPRPALHQGVPPPNCGLCGSRANRPGRPIEPAKAKLFL